MVEFFVSIFLTTIVLAVVYSVFRVQTHSLKSQEKRREAQQYTRSVLNLMVREIRNLGHFPVGACTTIPAHTNGIIAADKNLFHFATDTNANNDCIDPHEEVIYRFDASGCPAGFGNITRQDLNDTVHPLAQTLTDCNVPVAGGDSLFAYYPKDSTVAYGTPVAAANLGNIQRLLVTATVETKNPDLKFGGASIAVMKSNMDLRNRGLPL